MIDFRYHLVSIIAVFFALAVGIVLGAGPLGEEVQQNLPGQLETMSDRNRDLQNELLAFETSQQYQQDFVDLVADELVSERLSGESVLVVGLPGAGDDRLGNVRGMLERSGASVTGTMEVDGSWTAPESEAALDALAAELTTRPLSTEGGGYVRGAEVLSHAVLTSVRPEDVPVDPPAGLDGAPQGDPSEFMVEESVVTAFSDAGFIEVENELSGKAHIAVVVAAPTELTEPPAEGEGEEEQAGQSDGEPEAWFDKMIDLIGVLDESAGGVVVAGDRDVAAEHDVIGMIRTGEGIEGDITTVDSVELVTGRVAVVYAVAEQIQGGSGHYGLTESADALSPPIPPPPETADPPEGEPSSGGDGSGTGDDAEQGGGGGGNGAGGGGGTDSQGDDAEQGSGGGGNGAGGGAGGDGTDSQEDGAGEGDAVGAGMVTEDGEAL